MESPDTLSPPTSNSQSPEFTELKEVDSGSWIAQHLERSGSVSVKFRDRFPYGVNWPTTLFIGLMHVGAIAAFFFFSWQGLAVCLAMHFVTACLGITLGYHRLLTHGSFSCSKPMKYFFSLCGMMAVEGSPLYWVSTHRKHHAHSDKEDDPHSPTHGFWWAHILWLQPRQPNDVFMAQMKRWAPDLMKDPVQRFFHSYFGFVPLFQAIGLFALGYYLIGTGGVYYGLSMLLWGMCVRVVACYHSTWFVNSATHVWGYRNYTTTDYSRNNWWVALLSYGEGWHNNHHAHQRLARHGHRWWELDVTYAVIWTLKKTGLAWQVQDTLPKRG
ncbi:acyl-CoA desaturase [Lacunimicrobium album]